MKLKTGMIAKYKQGSHENLGMLIVPQGTVNPSPDDDTKEFIYFVPISSMEETIRKRIPCIAIDNLKGKVAETIMIRVPAQKVKPVKSFEDPNKHFEMDEASQKTLFAVLIKKMEGFYDPTGSEEINQKLIEHMQGQIDVPKERQGHVMGKKIPLPGQRG